MSGIDGTDSTLEYILSNAPGTLDRGPRSLSWVNERGGRGKQVEKSCLPALIIWWRSDGVDYSQD
jgi:hypothetical protein